jgi:hypothetical protein
LSAAHAPALARRFGANARQAACVALPGLMLLAAPACGPSADKREAQAVLGAIERAQDATGKAREEPLAALERMPARMPTAARAKESCAGALRALHDGTRRVEQLAGSLADGGAELREAERALDDAQRRLPDCQQATAELRRWLRAH